MKIIPTTPVERFYDSYMVEVETINAKGQCSYFLTLGPFKRVPHKDNLENLISLLTALKKEGDSENYHWVLGFSPWFNTRITTFEELAGYYTTSAADFHDEEEHEKWFELSRGFAKNWPEEPNWDDMPYQGFEGFKVFYYDFNGAKYNTEVKL